MVLLVTQGSKNQFEDVWDNRDNLANQDFDPKTFFIIHGSSVHCCMMSLAFSFASLHNAIFLSVGRNRCFYGRYRWCCASFQHQVTISDGGAVVVRPEFLVRCVLFYS